MGLSIVVHLLNLLAIPAISLVYYFRRYKYSQQGAFWAFVVSCLIIVFVQYGVIPGLVWLSARFELLFVNAFGLPFDSGLIRSEEHTSELQSLMRISYAVFCLKKKKKQNTITNIIYSMTTDTYH